MNQLLVKHAVLLESIESTLRTLTYVLPGRFEDAEYASEALYAFLNCVGIYHDVILAERRQISPSASEILPLEESPFNRYTRALFSQDTSHLYKHLAYTLTLVQFVEVLSEMSFSKFSNKSKGSKWNLILAIEAIKAGLRCGLFWKSGWRMLMHNAVPERSHPSPVKHSDGGAVSGKLSILEAKGSDVTAFIVAKALSSSAKKNALDLVKPLRGENLIAEFIYILRPLVYVLMLKRYGLKTWKPWIISLLLDSLSQILSRNGLAKLFKRGSKDLTAGRVSFLESEERRRRSWMLVYYVLRHPFYERFTKQRLEEFCNVLGRVPLLSLVLNIVREYIPLWDTVYFYTSSS